MKKYKKKKGKNEIVELEDLELDIDITLEGFEDDITVSEQKSEKEIKEEKKKEETEEDDKLDVNAINVVVERIEGGLIGSLRIKTDINKPIFRPGDIVHFRTPAKLTIGDFVLYKSHDEYFVRRIIKYKDEGIYVAGDSEKEYHVIRKDDVVGRALGRERKNKYLSLSLKNKKTVYSFTKVNLAYFRLGDRVLDYEGEVNNEALELAMQAVHEQEEEAKPVEYKYNIDLDSDLEAFLNPDVLVEQLEEARLAEEADALVEEYGTDEEYEEYEEYEEESEEATEDNSEDESDESEDESDESEDDSDDNKED